MEKDLQIIKQIIDQAVKAGIFQNIDSVSVAIRAWENVRMAITELDNIKKSKADEHCG
jgi:phage baseplate assembly protein W